MKSFSIIFLFLCISVAINAQRRITGTVVNATTNEPLVGASVFISNTSRGTVSNSEGKFELNDIPPGKYDLVISSVGFVTNAYSFSTEQLPLKLRFEMELKVKELANVLIEPSLEEGWDKWGKTFTDYFVGVTPNARKCKIKNPKAIRFRYYKKSNRLIAYSDEPVILENRALGYRIVYQLENFEIDYKKSTSAFAGFPLFEEMDKNRRSLQSRYHKNREKAYFGSMMHFMRGVYKENFSEEGFEVRRMVRQMNLEKQRVRELYKANRIMTSSMQGVNITVGNRDSLFTDSTAYYEKVLGQKDYTDVYHKEPLTADSLIIQKDSAYKAIFFTDYLHITYKKEFEDPEYVLYHHERRGVSFQQSFVILFNQNPIIIDANGSYYPPQEVYSFGYWGWDEKIANLLPLDFSP